MKSAVSRLVIVVSLLAGLACQRAPSARATISSAELAQQIQSGHAPIVLDVRSEEEFRSGHIPGARNVPIDQLEGQLATLGIAKSDEVVVHCERGARAAKAEALLDAAGYQHVVDLQGHMKGWRESGLPQE
ncbi:MAG TPA: rhodanese-like domain-containing protein [Myxococcota bacterium]|nr:rhodanese-like domain-containing protein [Myxococcota bacterium]